MSRFVAGISVDGACSWHRYNRVNELAGLFVVDSRVTLPSGRVYEVPAVAMPNTLFPVLGPVSNDFALCGGGGGYNRWTVTVAAMQEIIEAFAPLLEGEK